MSRILLLLYALGTPEQKDKEATNGTEGTGHRASKVVQNAGNKVYCSGKFLLTA